MSAIEELRAYARRLRGRFRLGVLARGATVLAAMALLATLLLVLILSRFAFSDASLWSARAVLIVALAAAATFGLALPLWRWSQRLWVRHAEAHFPQLGQRLITFTERQDKPDPFLELLADDTLKIAHDADALRAAVPERLLALLALLGIGCLGSLLWLIHAGPGYLGYGARALWTGPQAQPFYRIQVSPGNATVRRHADALVTAQLKGLGRPLAIHVGAAGSGRWEEAAMQPRPAGPGYQFLFAGVPGDIDYYVTGGALSTPHFHITVADIPVVKQIRVTYHAPGWMHQSDKVEEHGGDLKAVMGTQALLEVHTDLPLTRGVLILNDGRQIGLTAGAGNVARATLTLTKDGIYHIAARDTGVGTQRISEDYFIEAGEVKPPEVLLVRPERDYQASPIEEVTIQAAASDAFGLTDFALRYSVNGGPEHSVSLLRAPEATRTSGSTVLPLEGLKLVPGDVISFHAYARDARGESRTDMAFIQIEPFEREFSQSQQTGGGAGGGGANEQAQIAEREKEIIAATWRQLGGTHQPAGDAGSQAKFLADAQSALRGQAQALAGRLEMRDLQRQNEQFGSFEEDMAQAAAAMHPAATKLAAQGWKDALSDEQKALQYLLRAEATFRQIQVAFGSAAGGTPNSAGRDLASLFDLELDTDKNQYESAQTAATPEQRSARIDDALKKLDELARRQSALASQAQDGQQSAEQRWQQEMLRRKMEELTQQLQQLSRGGAAAGSPSAGQQGQASQRSREALSRLQQAKESMRRAAVENDGAAARQASQQIREAMGLLGGQQSQDAGRQIDSLSQEAARLAREQHAQSQRMQALQSRWPGRSAVESLINDRQKLADDLAALTAGVRAAERATLERNRDAAKKLREALGDLEQADTETAMQRSADRLRRGYTPLTDQPESEMAAELSHLQQQLGQAGQAMAGAGNAPPPGDAALEAAERLRGRLASLDDTLRRSGQAEGGGGSGPVNGGWNTGSNGPLPAAAARQRTPAGDPEAQFRQATRELEQLKRAIKDDPDASRQADALVRELQKLAPKRFPGNPAMIDELYGRVVAGVDRLELTLRHEPADSQPGQVHSDSAAPMPEGYQGPVADYYRRLSQTPNQNP